MQQNKEAKEIPIFGEKSLREEAYHQKILQLEKEISRLESLAKDLGPASQKTGAQPTHLDGLYYESLLSFDKRVKKEQEFLEKKAIEIAEKLNLQAQRNIQSIEASFRNKIKWLAIILFLVVGLFLPLFIVAAFFYKVNVQGVSSFNYSQLKPSITQDDNLNNRLSYIKRALQTQTIYHNQYDVTYMDVLNGVYVVEIELNFQPSDRWFLKNLAQDIINLFQRYAGTSPAEFSFLYKGKLYGKASIAGLPPRVHFQYF